MAKINTVANNGLTIIENYNKLLEQIRKAKTIDDVRFWLQVQEILFLCISVLIRTW